LEPSTAELAQTHYEMGYLHSPRGSGAAVGKVCLQHTQGPSHARHATTLNHFKPFQIRCTSKKKAGTGTNTRREGPCL